MDNNPAKGLPELTVEEFERLRVAAGVKRYDACNYAHALGAPKRSPPPPPPLPTMAQVVAHLLQRRHQLQDVVAVDCLALAQLLIGQPPRKIPCDELREVMGSHTQNCLGNRLRRLRRADLIECYAGRCGDPGYQFLRIGPVLL